MDGPSYTDLSKLQRIREAETAAPSGYAVVPYDLIEGARMARKRLETFADDANAGRVHYSARELKRKIWAAFAEFDAAQKQEAGKSQ